MNDGDWTAWVQQAVLADMSMVNGKTIGDVDTVLHTYHQNPAVDWSRVHAEALRRVGNVTPFSRPYWVQGRPVSVLAFWDADARGRLAQDPNTPPSLLTIMASDPDLSVQHRVASNPNTPADVREVLSENTESTKPYPTEAATKSTVRDSKKFTIMMTSAITTVLLGLVVAALIIAGLNNAYSFKVVDQPARKETYHQQFTGKYDITPSHLQVCGDGEDYASCVKQHEVLYEAVCADTSLTEKGLATCRSLNDFLAGSRVELQKCGSGCMTKAGENGLWGWPYIRAVPATSLVSNNDRLPEISHSEHCYFKLGPARIGNCPGKP